MSHTYTIYIRSSDGFNEFKQKIAEFLSVELKPLNNSTRVFHFTFNDDVWCVLSMVDFPLGIPTDGKYQYEIAMEAPSGRDGAAKKPPKRIRRLFAKLRSANEYDLLLVWDGWAVVKRFNVDAGKKSMNHLGGEMAPTYTIFVQSDEELDQFLQSIGHIFSKTILPPTHKRDAHHLVIDMDEGLDCRILKRILPIEQFTDKNYEYQITMNAPRGRDGTKEKPIPTVQYVFDKLKGNGKYGLMLIWDSEKLWEMFEPSSN